MLAFVKKLARLFASLSAPTRIAISSIAAFVAYGGWAFLVNASHGQAAAVKSGLVQGCYSFLLTLVMTGIIEALYYSIARTGRIKLAALVTIITVCLTVYITSWTVNSIAGTPEILKTVILGYIASTIYTTSYVLGLMHKPR